MAVYDPLGVYTQTGISGKSKPKKKKQPAAQKAKTVPKTERRTSTTRNKKGY